jgi:hypothetical protein
MSNHGKAVKAVKRLKRRGSEKLFEAMAPAPPRRQRV